ncbi:MAG: ABC transporter permease [Chloroflexi bacterium]|nr:ABC transporter permease [Chloroflexota bacterium]
MSRWLDRSDVINDLAVLVILACVVGALAALWRSPVWGVGLRRLRGDRLAMICVLIMAVYAAVAVTDSVTWRSGPGARSMTALDHVFARMPTERTYSAPLADYDVQVHHRVKLLGRHWMGTDALGNDVVHSVLRGCRTAWIVGGFTLVMALPVALVLGIAAGYFGGWVDDAVQYLYITLSSIPNILLLIALMMVLGKGLIQICVALAITEWVGLARYLRGETLKHREKEYVLAARAMGVHSFKILQRHILPNVFHLVIISATLSFSSLILSETILSYLGIGVPSGVGSWGNMIDGARMELARDPIIWWNLAGASAALFVLVLAANLLGDAVRDAFDPRLRE